MLDWDYVIVSFAKVENVGGGKMYWRWAGGGMCTSGTRQILNVRMGFGGVMNVVLFMDGEMRCVITAIIRLVGLGPGMGIGKAG